MSVKIVIADNNTVFRKSLRLLIEEQCDTQHICITGEAECCSDALSLLEELSPDIIIASVHMPGLEGHQLVEQLSKRFPEVKSIALSSSNKVDYILRLFRAGAAGFLHNSCTCDDIKRAVKAVMENQTYISPEVTGAIIHSFLTQSKRTSVPGFARLSIKEQEVFKLIAEGKSIKEIASALKTKEPNIESYRRRLMYKLNMDNMVALTKYAIREGLIPV